jgi:dimeric dUTPase (all-alpha-NTP-PPase superfamily)
MFSRWLARTKRLQSEYYGVDFDKLRSTPNALADYLMWNNLAARDELSEVLAESAWKPWSDIRGTFNKDAMRDEIVDVLHFIANIACAVGITDEELSEAYLAKMEENRRRRRDGYSQRGFGNDAE